MTPLCTILFRNRFLALIVLWISASLSGIGQKANKLFEVNTPLTIYIYGKANPMLRDRADESTYRDFKIVVDGNKDTVPVKLRTRGNFRRSSGECKLPPIMMNFQKKLIPAGSVFAGQDKIKLVVPCIDEQLLLKEYLVYKLYNQITPASFKVRLARIQWRNDLGKDEGKPFLAFLLENEESMAKRNEAKLLGDVKVAMTAVARENLLPMTVFEFMIGNTDWGFSHAHNVVTMSKQGSSPVPVPYDFDFSGLVSAPYALPPEMLELRDVRERRYRGYCMPDLNVYQPVFDQFKAAWPSWKKIIAECPFIKNTTAKEMQDYLQGFFEIINNTKELNFYFGFPCREGQKGKIEIKGLNG